MVQPYLEQLAPSLFVAGFFLIFVLGRSRRETWTRAVTCAVVFAVAIRYLVWRFTDTVLPMHSDEGFAFWWVWALFVVELLAFADITLFLVAMSRYCDRSAEADNLQTLFLQKAKSEWPAVDVFIPTYNEPLDVLERTILGALALDYPRDKLRVYVLDDKKRDWLRDFCAASGAEHVTRLDNTHAKAGNMNNGLKVSSGDLIAVFDADFVPYRHFLLRTVPFFSDRTIGIVQTPQHFFNSDPVQWNLSLERIWPDEQRLFFDEMAASRDAWNVSFCCGSCSITRRDALDAIGGFPTESITEDLLTTLAMLNKGYKTRYLNERLSMGLAAENLKGYFVQRERWCQGGIQTLYLKNGPLRGDGLTLFQRIMFTPLSWLVQYLVRFFVLIVPAVYLWTGVAPLYFTQTDVLVHYQLPVIVAYFFLMGWITPTRYLPLLSTAVGAFATFRMLPTVIASVIKPFGRPFRVTPKGSGNEDNAFDAYTFGCIAAVITITALGLIVNIVPEWARISDNAFSTISIWWAVINIAVLLIAGLICFEKSKRLTDNFQADERATMLLADGRRIGGRLVRIGLNTASIQPDVPIAAGTEVTFKVDGVEPFAAQLVPFRPGHERRKAPRLAFELTGRPREQMIVKLYTGAYSQDIEELDKSAIVYSLWLRAFGASTR